MNQPIEDRMKRLEEEQKQIKEEMRKLKEQQTEPIKITRLEIDSGSMHKRLDAVQEDTNILKIQMEGARADIRVIKANQGDLLGYLENHSQRLENIEQKQEAHTEILGQLMNFIEPHDKRFDSIEEGQAEHTKRFDRLEAIMMQILKRLPTPGGE
jgi:chromosome segregation ATPase